MSEQIVNCLWINTKAIDPGDPRLSPKPRSLAFRIMPHVEFGLLDCAFQTALSSQILDHATIAMCPDRAVAELPQPAPAQSVLRYARLFGRKVHREVDSVQIS